MDGLDGIAFLIAGGYVGTVVWKGNVSQLMALLAGELGFVEWAVAIGALIVLARTNTIGPIGKLLVAAAGIGVAVKLAGSPNIQQLLKSWASSGSFTGAASATEPGPSNNAGGTLQLGSGIISTIPALPVITVEPLPPLQ